MTNFAVFTGTDPFFRTAIKLPAGMPVNGKTNQSPGLLTIISRMVFPDSL